MKKNKGFTLMEMLIVVAIIAVLVAIAIPTFTSSLEKSKESADAANLRAAYASCTVYTLEHSTACFAEVALTQGDTSFTKMDKSQIGTQVLSTISAWDKTSKILYVKVDADGTMSITPADPGSNYGTEVNYLDGKQG